jgi:hypothetical protein
MVAFRWAGQFYPTTQSAGASRSRALNPLPAGARAEAGPAAPVAGSDGGAADCAGVKGLQHTIIDSAPAGRGQPVEVLIGLEVTASKIALFYRPEKATEFVEGKLAKQGDCKYTGEIPASAMKGGVVHYYVAALGDGGKAVVAKGSSGSPNIIELTASVPGGDDGEDPINGRAGRPASDEVSRGQGGGAKPGKPAKVYVQVAGGTGFGYVTGKTEFGNPVENCCIGNSLVVVTPELGFRVGEKLAVGLAARLGLPIGANIDGPTGKSSTLAPAFLLRLRYAFARSGEGLNVIAQAGGGVIRNTIKLKESQDGMDTDIVGQGPLLLGAGVGYTKRLAGNVAFVGDLSVLGAIAVVDKLGNAPNLGNGVGADLSLGLSVGF